MKRTKYIIDRPATLEETRRSFRMSRKRFHRILQLVDELFATAELGPSRGPGPKKPDQ